MNKSQPIYLREIEIKFKKRRVKAGSAIDTPLTDASQVYQLFSDLENEAKEKLICISLDSKLKIISFEVVALGSINGLSTRPFEVIRSAIALNAFGIILVHNHPSGDPQPSDHDKVFTDAIFDLTNRGGMVLYDHVIIGNNGRYFSFIEQNLLHSKTQRD